MSNPEWRSQILAMTTAELAGIALFALAALACAAVRVARPRTLCPTCHTDHEGTTHA